MLKRLFSLSLVLCLLISALPTTAAAAEMKPTFLASGENATVTGSIMAAVNTNFSTNYNSYVSFSSEAEPNGEINASVAIIDEAEISGYRYFPESGETLAVVSPEFPLIYPSGEEPPKNLLDKNLNAIEAYTAGTTTNVIDSDGYSHPMQCLYVGTYCTVWGSMTDTASIQITTDMAQNIGQEFDSDYLTTVNSFGQGIDADKDGKVAIFCYDIDQDYGTTITTYTAGFFRPTDMVNSSGYIGSAYFGPSNYNGMGYDCIHIDTYPTMGYPSSAALTDVEGCYSTLIHEYQHLINFSAWVNTGATGDSMETYLNEAFSMAAEHMICGATETSDRVEYFNSTRYTPGYSLTYWGGSLSNYSNSYLFGQYIRTRYAQLTGTNGNGVFKAITNEWYRYIHNTEIEAVASVLETTPQQLILDFWAAVYLKDSSGPYGFNGESWADAISPYLYSSVAAGSTNIGNGSAKFYLLADGSYTPTTSSALAFIGFSDAGEITSPDGFSGGSGTEDDPYLIATKEDLDNVRNHLDAHFKMTADIVFTEADFAENGAFYNDGEGWEPIGNATVPFTGTFDGDSHTIKGLYQNISASDTCYGGLFGYASGARIKNVGMAESDISVTTTTGSVYVGGIAGHIYSSSITNCYNTGSVSAIADTGPSVGGYSGGIVGNATFSAITSCYNIGNVYSDDYTGGILGYSRYTPVSICYNVGSISSSLAGGIVSNTNSSIDSCYNTGKIRGYNAGGIAETIYSDSTVSNCYNIGSVVGRTTGAITAGWISSDSIISNCYYLDNCHAGASNIDTSTKCTIDQMKQQSTFVGFDFENVWLMSNDSYPLPVLQNLTYIESPENTTEFAGGNGTAYNPYLISNKNHLDNVRNYKDACFKMTADIVFTEADFVEDGAFYHDGEGWQSIGNATVPFTGTFDGEGHTITGLKQNASAASDCYGGLFGYTDSATIKNVGMVDSDISVTTSSGIAYAGGIVGKSTGYNVYNPANNLILNCYSTGSICGDYVGGIIGYTDGSLTVTNCYNTGTIKGYNAGGIVGHSWTDPVVISSSHNSGTINGSNYAGGVIGYNEACAHISDCYNTGNISALYSGGIIGKSADNYVSTTYISNCFNKGEICGTNVGGIVASAVDIGFTNCYNTGHISGNDYAGGIVGWAAYTTISNCYSSGAVMGTRAGGIVGSMDRNSSVSNSYNEGTITGRDYSGGIAGFMTNASITTCYNIATIKGTPTDGSYLSCSGGIVGCAHTSSAITDCLNIGPVKNEMSGGIAGAMYNLASISKCYNVGKLAGSVWEGGIAAFITPDHNVTIRDCYYLETIDRCVGNDNTAGVANSGTCSVAQSGSTNIGGRRQITFSIAVSGGAGGTVGQTVTVILGEISSASTKPLLFVTQNAKEETESVGEESTESKAETTDPFADLNESAYYYDAVLWAAENDFLPDDVFDPDGACTRKEMMAMLWLAAGSPEPTSAESRFTDVDADDLYYKAILWAAESGITLGSGDGTTFSPDATCIRAQIAAFLYRFAGSAAVDSPRSFSDVSEDSYYADAILWAAENGITLGTGNGTTFSPNAACTRSQMAVFLHRYFAK